MGQVKRQGGPGTSVRVEKRRAGEGRKAGKRRGGEGTCQYPDICLVWSTKYIMFHSISSSKAKHKQIG